MGLNMMKAVLRERYGLSDVLRVKQVEVPIQKDNELLVRIHATTVSRTDMAILMGKPLIFRFVTGLFKPHNNITGTDFAGKIEKVGINVKSFKVGDRVFGFDDTGLRTHAEYVTITEDKAIELIPDNLSYEEAAASLEGSHYAYNFINKVNIKKGEKILVNGATGAIGISVLQFSNYLGANVNTVCKGENTELVKSLGAKKIIDYTKEDFREDNEKYNYIFDAVGKSSFFNCKHLLKSKGIYISTELGYMLQNPILALITKIFGDKKVKFPIPSDIKGSIKFTKDLIENDQFKSVIDRVYSLENINEAYDYVFSGQKVGNVIIKYY